MKLLVTGGAGFIGSNFIHYWLETYPQDKLVNLDALTYAGNLENLKDMEANPQYSFIKGDITDPALVEQAMQGIEVVVHFAAETHVDRSILGPTVFIRTNVLGTQVLLEAARKHNTRFHHISTDEVFGDLANPNCGKFNETTPYEPSSPYSASKAGSDHLVRAYYRTFGLPVTISNCSNNFGPYMFPEKFIPLAVTNLLEGKTIPIYGAGNQIRDWLFVRDHCVGVDLILKQGKIGETYCLGGMTRDITNLEVAKLICQYMDKSEGSIEYVKDRPGHDVRYAIDWTKANRELGYKPAHEFEEYLKKTINWYVEHLEWWKRVKSGDYLKYYEQQYG